MPITRIDGISTRYEIIGSGQPVLFFSPGGFDATLDKWSTLGVYERIRMLEYLPQHYQCILFDRRETGLSGGRVEKLSWDHYVNQGKGLLDYLGFERTHLIGGCMGCCPVMAFAVKHPETVLSMTLFWPVGGPHYRIRARERFETHLAFVVKEGLEGVVNLVNETNVGFGKDPRIGPWASVIRQSKKFAASYSDISLEEYKLIIEGIQHSLIDRDTAPGAEPEDLLNLDISTLIIPGKDLAHATSAARYLHECLPLSQYWDIAPDLLSEKNVPTRILNFLNDVSDKT
ncbi:MAG: alpha/beta hydrolase [Rhodospirillaceae bacterium]|nr:alpha/beta hydrolase [Rhodospirillaceae bacterium]